MYPERKSRLFEVSGFALLTAMVFSLILVIAGLAFFSMASYETRSALYRQDSSEAFYMADGAIELARAKFLENRTWFLEAGPWYFGWDSLAIGHGRCDLAVDSTGLHATKRVKLLATGHARTGGHLDRANRAIEIMAEIPPTALGLSILINGNADFNGNVNLGGYAHVNGTIETNHVDPDTAVSGGLPIIIPPHIYTDAAHFPGDTYYDVRPSKTTSPYEAKIFDRNGVDITGVNKMSDVITGYNNGTKHFTFTFDKAALYVKYFDPVTGVFKRNPGDNSVVVDFGEAPVVNPPGPNGVNDLTFDKCSSVSTTIITTRFVGVTEEERVDPGFWLGGMTTVKQIVFEPRNGIAMIAYDFQKTGGANVQMGTTAWPALLYVTHDVPFISSNTEFTGSIICLGDWHNTGTQGITYNSGFISNLPDYLQNDWNNGVSGTLKIMRWREVAATGN